jgi:hypothetical protein
MTRNSDAVQDKPKNEKGWIPRSGGSFKVEDRYESDLSMVDPVTFKIKKKVHLRYPNYSGTLTTAGGTSLHRANGRDHRRL